MKLTPVMRPCSRKPTFINQIPTRKQVGNRRRFQIAILSVAQYNDNRVIQVKWVYPRRTINRDAVPMAVNAKTLGNIFSAIPVAEETSTTSYRKCYVPCLRNCQKNE